MYNIITIVSALLSLLKGNEDVMFSKNLKVLRLSKGLTQAEFAKILNTSVSTVGMYEQGRRSPDNEMLIKISSIFSVSIDELLGTLNINKEISEVINDVTKILKEHKGLMFKGKPVSALDKIKLANAIKVAAAVTISDSAGDAFFKPDVYSVL